MGALAASAQNPLSVAGELGIAVHELHGVTWLLVGSTSDRVIYRWDPRPEVREARIWEGIAQCLLTRLGVPWTETEAQLLGSRMRMGIGVLH